MTRNLFIALEGIDGSGTTSQGQRLAERLRAAGQAVHLTAEPTTGPIGRVIREALGKRENISDQVLAVLFAADRLDHLEREIEPHLDAGELVLTDRYLLSSFSYQSVKNPLEWVVTLNDRARRPDASILLRVSPEVAAHRRAKRGGPEELFDAAERQRAVAEAYDRVFTRNDVGPTSVIDAERDFEAVADDLWRTYQELLGRPA